MKLIKHTLMVMLIAALMACGHGYEGEFQSKAGSSNEFMNAFTEIAGSQHIVIGPDYIDSQGVRTVFDDIFVRESGGVEYLVFKNAESEQAWRIIDEDTLMQGNSLISVKLVRVK